MIAIAVLGLLAFSGIGECAITSWTSPVQAGTGGNVATAILTLAEGYTGDLFTFTAVTGATAITSYSVEAQTPGAVFEVTSANAATGVLSIVSGQVIDYEAGASIELKVIAVDDTSTPETGTVTVSITVTNVAPVFIPSKVTIEVPDATAASTAVATMTAVDAGASFTYDITAASNTNTDFAIVSTGIVSTAKILAVGTTSSYTLVITAADNGATAATGTATLVVCVGTCPATGSGAAGLAAGILSLISLAVIMLK